MHPWNISHGLKFLAEQNWPDTIQVDQKSTWLGKTFEAQEEISLNEVTKRIEGFVQDKSLPALGHNLVDNLLIVSEKLKQKGVNVAHLEQIIRKNVPGVWGAMEQKTGLRIMFLCRIMQWS